MPIIKTTVTGPILDATGTAYANATLVFTPQAVFGDDTADTVIAQTPVEVVPDESTGAFSVDLAPSDTVYYSVVLQINYPDTSKKYTIGRIYVPGAGPVALEDLLPVFDPGTPTNAELLAALSSAVVSAQADATQALADAATAQAGADASLKITSDLSDLNSAATARTNLELGTAATTAASDYATAAQGATADTALAKAVAATPHETRASLASAIAAGLVPVDGREYRAAGLSYLGSTGATDIPDMPGLVPNGVGVSPFLSVDDVTSSPLTYAGMPLGGAGGDTVIINGANFATAPSGASDYQFVTNGGVLIKPQDKSIHALRSPARVRSTHRDQAEAEAKNISFMAGYAEQAGCTGGGGGTTRWVTNGRDAIYDPPAGSLRAAIDAAVTGDVIVFDPRFSIRVELVASISTQGTDGIIIAAPGGNVEIAHQGDVTAFRIYSDDIIIRGLREVVLPKTAEGTTDRDFIDLNPDLCRKYWIDQCTFVGTYDGAIDIAVPSGSGVLATPSYGTVSRCEFVGIDKTSLIQCADAAHTDATMIYVTWYQCLFDHVAQRNPSAREQAQIDVVNCFYRLQVKSQVGATSACYGADARTGGKAIVRDCWFTTAVGSGYDAVSQGDVNGTTDVSNCYASDALVFDDTGTITTPAYSISITPASSGVAGREAMREVVEASAGAGAYSGFSGAYTFDASSSEEPNGVDVRAVYGHVTGRFVWDGSVRSGDLPKDDGRLTIGSGNTNGGQRSVVVGDAIITDDTSRNVLSVGRDHSLVDAADQSVSGGRGHNMETENGAAFGQFSADGPGEIFRVGTGTSDGARETGLAVQLDNGTVVGKQFAVKRVNTVAISSGAITVTGGYHTVSTESAAATDDLDTINFSETPSDGQEITLMPSSSSYAITVKHNTNILLPGGTDITLDGAYGETLTLMWAAHRSAMVLKSK